VTVDDDAVLRYDEPESRDAEGKGVAGRCREVDAFDRSAQEPLVHE
jgi:hypothetical protein